MSLHSFEQGPFARGLDITVYVYLLLNLGLFLALGREVANDNMMYMLIVGGLVLWTLLEYTLHRFVLHGMAPFKALHAAHHRQPGAAMGAPTLLSLGLISGLIFLPMLLWQGIDHAAALTLGVVAGYTGYTLLHWYLHEPDSVPGWFKTESRFHAVHHQSRHLIGNFGVTNCFWDLLFRTALRVHDAPRSASLITHQADVIGPHLSRAAGKPVRSKPDSDTSPS